MTLYLDLQLASKAKDIPSQEQFELWVGKALAGSGRDETELTVRIVDEEEGLELNSTYRGRDYATNVLSFPFEVPDGIELPLLGDLVICAAVVAKEAAEQNKALAAHWAHLVIHGTLHLLGYDHIKDEDAEQMESKEIALLQDLGYPDPYGDRDV
ncbi:rRNA maturation RNase YbeY [Gallaecimonas xiamenensis]|uniref:Endoribonuclease YbeY n=1 Tax=Gallaecimonas xiamenensis 3-C-1 TaxID=745411 RepID=K2JAR2_9GAMM|nr:rRNA maturation RNase YbeY [Gallaecimonas xiamenensis]EKE67614.1 metal-binding heat shock protein [Gallaecimonas xiamenensis 3-C-1]